MVFTRRECRTLFFNRKVSVEGASGAGGGVQAFQHSIKEHKVDVFGAS